ncbi:MAG TPA: hypothetical protein VGH98_13240 [Gemmatimonadaceae bacterium]|jgi:hypothetical protein
MNRCPARCDRITGDTAHFADEIDNAPPSMSIITDQILTLADRIATITEAM